MSVIVTVQDLRSCAFCAKGARRWFEFHNLDWQTFISAGLPAETLAATGDAQALMAIEAAKKRQGVEL